MRYSCIKRHGPYREGKSYRKNVNHEKKPKEDNPWQQKKTKHFRHNGKWRSGFFCQPTTKKPYQKCSNKKRRTFVRRNMSNRNYDAIPVGFNNSKLMFIDPWLWS